MFRGKSTTSATPQNYSTNPYLQKNNGLRRGFSNSGNLKRGGNGNSIKGVRRRMSTKKKQKRDIEQLVSLGEAYLIVHLCAGEVVVRGLMEPDIFKPVRIGDSANEVRYLINCLLRDNRTEFEDELKYQDIHNVVAGIRWTLRNCTSTIVPYEYYEQFVKYEQEWQYDPRKGSFNQFLSYLDRHNKTILIELFDLFAMTMEQSHINHMHPTRILKSMALQIFNESQTKSYENFQSAYQEWLKYSNALVHLFLAYLRERACSTQLPERLHLLLRDYVDCRKKCLMNSSVSGNGKEIIISEHILPDITVADLDEVIRSRIDYTNNKNKINDSNRTSVIRKNTKAVNTNRNSLSDMFPELFETFSAIKRKASFKSSPNIVLLDDPRTVETKWDELQSNGYGILSEEALKLFFAYDDRDINPNPISVGRKKSWKKKGGSQRRKNEKIDPLPKMEFVDDSLIGGSLNLTDGNFINDSSSSSEYPDDKSSNDGQTKSGNKELRESVDSSSNVFSLSSTLGPSSDGGGGGDSNGTGFVGNGGYNYNYSNNYNDSTNYNGSTILGNTLREESQEVRDRGTSNNRVISFFCIKRRPRSYSSESSAYMQGHTYEDWEDWNIIDQTVDLSDYLTVETIDALFPYVWIEANIGDDDEQWGEWIFIEPRRGLIHECEWIMIEERNQYMLDWEQNLNNTNRTSRVSKISALSNLSINLPWMKNSKRGGSSKSSASSVLPTPSHKSSNHSFTRQPFNQSSNRSNSSFNKQQSPYMQRPDTPTEQIEQLLDQPTDRGQEYRDRYLQQQQEEEETKLYQIHRYQQDQQKLVLEQQKERERQERERQQQAQEKREDETEDIAQYYRNDSVYEQYHNDERSSELDYYDDNDRQKLSQQPQLRSQNSSQLRTQLQNQNSQQFRQQQPSRQAYEENDYDESQNYEREGEYYNQSPYPQSVRQSPMQSRQPSMQSRLPSMQSRLPSMQGRQSPNLGGKQSPYVSTRGREVPFSVTPQPRQSPIMANGQLPGRQTPIGARQPTPQLSDQMSPGRQGRIRSPNQSPVVNNAQLPGRPLSPNMNNAQLPGRPLSPNMSNAQLPGRPLSPNMNNAQLPGRSPNLNNAQLPGRSPNLNNAQLPGRPLSPNMNNAQLPGRSPNMNNAQLPGRPLSPGMMNARLPNGRQSPAPMNAQIPGRQSPVMSRQNLNGVRTPQMQNAQYPQQYQQQYNSQQTGYQQNYSPQYSQQSQQQYPPQNQYSQPQSQQYPPLSPPQSPPQYPQQYPQQQQQAYNNNGMEVAINRPPPSIPQQISTTGIDTNISTNNNVITQTTTNKIQTSRKIQVPNANNTTTEIEETVVKFVSTTQHRLQPESNNTRNPRGPTESEIIDGYSVPYLQEQNQVSPYQPQSTTYNPPGTYGPFPASYNSTPSSPIMNSQGSYVAAQRGNLDQSPNTIEYISQQPNLYFNTNIPSEFFNQQQQLPNMYNSIPTQIPMTIPMDIPAQQLYLKYPNTHTPSSPTSPHQQPYFPPGYVPENDKKGKGVAKISKKFRIAN